MMKKVPKRRFKGFLNAGDWEQRKLKSIANMIVTGGDIDKNKIKESGTYPVIANALSKDGIVGYYDDSYRIEAPAVTVTGRGDIGVAKARHQNFTPVVRLLSLTTAHDVDFVEYAINNLKIVSESTGVPQLTVPQLSNYKIHITSIIEERKIGLFISKLDNLITLHQRKLEKLQATKKALLYELFPIENSRRPKRRFKGFTGDWEQRKLEGLCDLFTDGDWIESKDQCGSGVRLIQTGNIGVTEYLDKPDNKKWISGETFNQLHCKEVFPGDILISRLPEPAGRACIIPHLGTKMITAVDCTIVRTSTNTTASFLVQYLSSQPYFNEVNKCLAGGTRQRISRSALAEFKVLVPSEKAEQDIIGKVFDKFDILITLHQRKLEKLKNLKAAYLNEMFV